MEKELDIKAREWLDNNDLSYHIWNNKYRCGEESFDEWLDRVSGGDSEIRRLIFEKKFLFGGRTLANRGTNRGSYSNCYSIGFVPDSLSGILDVAKQIGMTFKSQGGQGLSLSKIRPKGSIIHGQFESDGIIPFMEIFNTVTESVSQGGSRKGALLMSIDINHKEAESFIKIKSDLKRITKANLSVEIGNDFMEKLDDEENRRKWKLVAEHACKYAEPGIIFSDRFRNYNIMQYVDGYQIETCNPCGEQPLPKHGACNLSSINISEYILDKYKSSASLDYDELRKDVRTIVRAMDTVLEENLPNHALEEQKHMAQRYRNIGIGIMGLHDALIKLRLVYGSKEAIEWTGNMMKFIFRESLLASIELAKELGSFPGYDRRVWDADIINNAFTKEEIAKFKEMHLLRNCSLLSIAPTGSIGTMLNISTGVEPFFDLSYNRKTVSLDGEETVYKVDVPVIEEARKNGVNEKCFITSNDIDYKDRIAMQGAMQKWVDTAISSTVNLPKETTSEQVEELYLLAWKNGLKGVTIYVDGSRDPILSKEPVQDKKDIPCPCENETTLTHSAPKRPKVLTADIKRFKNGGDKWIAFVGLFNGQPFEIFTGLSEKIDMPDYVVNCEIIKNKIDKEVYNEETGTNEVRNVSSYDIVYQDKNGNKRAIFDVGNIFRTEFDGYGRMISAVLRHGMPIKYVVSTIKSIKFNNETINSWKAGVIRALKTYIKNGDVQGEVCPECGGKLVRENGCIHCIDCGWSKCG